MLYEDKIRQIDSGNEKINEFDKDALFLNIYHFWCFTNYRSMYYIWHWTASDCLKMNLKKKWPKNSVNVNLFIELCERKTEMINPVVFYDENESYFEKILLLEEDLMKKLKPHHIIKEKKKKRKKNYKCIKQFFMIFLGIS